MSENKPRGPAEEAAKGWSASGAAEGRGEEGSPGTRGFRRTSRQTMGPWALPVALLAVVLLFTGSCVFDKSGVPGGSDPELCEIGRAHV